MANSVTARFNDDCKVHVAMSDDTTVTKAVIIDAEGNETDIGGGGSSDFSTAEVTIHSNVEGDVLLSVAIAEEASPPFEPDASSSYEKNFYKNDERTLSVILYKGLAIGYITSDNILSVTVTGDIEVIDNISLKIRGAGTITINNANI